MYLVYLGTASSTEHVSKGFFSKGENRDLYDLVHSSEQFFKLNRCYTVLSSIKIIKKSNYWFSISLML